MLANWLGLEVDEAWPIERKRELARRGDELRAGTTREGLELTLKIAFPEHPLRVEDSGASRGKAKARPRKPTRAAPASSSTATRRSTSTSSARYRA